MWIYWVGVIVYNSYTNKTTVTVRIILKFDIIVLQEIVDTSEKAVSNLIEAVNKKDGGDNYKIELSPRVGRNNQKEQYGFIYRTTKVSVEESCIYPDPDDVFIREPFIAKFSTKAAANINSFTIIAIHTQPKV